QIRRIRAIRFTTLAQPFWSALTCQRFVTWRLVAARLPLGSLSGRDKSRPLKAIASYRTPNLSHSSDSLTTLAQPFWRALTCQRFGTRRLVSARLPLGSLSGRD